MIDIRKLVHGSIYIMSTGGKARCNICSQDTEIWFTRTDGGLVGGNPIRFFSDKDESFKNNDIKQNKAPISRSVIGEL
jgi:hypothetical protein